LLNRGADPETIGKAVDIWVGKKAAGEDVYPGHLEHIYAQLVAGTVATAEQRRTGRKLSHSEQNFMELQARKTQPSTLGEIASGS
jgi:hypothetical protein